MSLTIAIPSYNKEKYIERCINSILAEKESVDRVILIDNCSTDNTFKIAQKYIPQIECFQNEKNVGMSGNFNKCIELCKTEWLMIVHADDEIVHGSITKYLDLIEKYPSVFLVHADSYSIIDGNQDTKSLSQQTKKEFWRAGLDAISCPYGVCSAVMVRKAAYDALGVFIPSSLSSDVEMWGRIASHYDIGYINAPTVIYHVSSSSTGPQSLINRSVKEIKEDWDNLNEKIASNYPTNESRVAFLKKTHELGPYTYWNVLKANIRAGNVTNIIQSLYIILFMYNGAIPLTGLILQAIKKVLKEKLGIKKTHESN